MPEIKKYEGKKKQEKAPSPVKTPLKAKSSRKTSTKKPSAESEVELNSRRPHREPVENQPSFFDETAAIKEEPVTPPEPEEKIHLNFFGSELLRYKAPKVMELADSVAEEWVHDGDFAGLPVGNPLAQFVASKAFRKAKDVEKKLEEKGVFMLARVGVEYVKAEINKRKK